MISTKGRYALRVIIELAEQNSDHYIPLKEIAKKQNLSEKYLEIILKTLVKANYLKGLRGKGGGYKLTRSPEEYIVGDILEMMEETLAPVACLVEGAEPCERADSCRTLPMWKDYYKMVHDFFYNITIADLIKNEQTETEGKPLCDNSLSI